MERPAGVSVIAVGLGMVAAYLCVSGLAAIASPGREPITQITLLALGLLFVGPYVSLLVGICTALIAWGLWRMNNWARVSAMIAVAAGIVLLVPGVSSPALGWAFAASGAGMILRVMIVWYLSRDDVARAFSRSR